MENHLSPSGISNKKGGCHTAETEPAASAIRGNKQQGFVYTFEMLWLHREQRVLKTELLDLNGLNLCSSKLTQVQGLFCAVAFTVAAT